MTDDVSCRNCGVQLHKRWGRWQHVVRLGPVACPAAEPEAGPAERPEIVAGMLKDGDRVLLCHRSPQRRWYPDVWDFPGGHVEPGETSEAALVRELKEELDVVIDPPSHSPIAVINAADFRLLLWLIESWTGTPVNVAPEEHDEFAWVDRAEAGRLRLAHPDYAEVLSAALTTS
jgi:mutator protein MutT